MNTRNIFNGVVLGGITLFAVTAPPQKVAHAQEQEAEQALTSKLAEVVLPDGALRVSPKIVPSQITDALGAMIKSGGPRVKRGQTEVLAWTGENYKVSRVPLLKSQISARLKAAGWTYEEGEPIPGTETFTMISIVKTTPARKGIIGFWASTDEALMLAWTEMLPGDTGVVPPAIPTKATTGDDKNDGVATNATESNQNDAARTGATVLELKGLQRNINVMKAVVSSKPSFPKLTLKPGFVRGYVKDWKGRPLQGAVIGVRSTAVGGFYSGAQTKTDARGYYEVATPWGRASFYCAGYGVDWGDEGRAALGLGTADGEADQFATAEGAVENWILWPYGIADRDGVSENPQYSGNYFGGTFSVYTSIGETASAYELPVGATVELSLSPVGTLFDGSKGRSFLLRRPLEFGGNLFYVNNVPLGHYKISARLIQNGQSSPLKIKETGPYANNPFGLDPKESRGETTLTFRPQGAKAEMATANHSNWESLGITLYP
ncbi:hypothetical protein IAD21_06345 [Abditibacteriota bacterium]|nr:hypothetical protein IAD21_06345 [Abditibacteriota bacterium]